MNDKKPLVAHGEYGKDEDSTQALIKKQEAIELDNGIGYVEHAHNCEY